MYEVITFQNFSRDSENPQQFTHDWVDLCLQLFTNLAALTNRFKGFPKGQEQLAWAQSSIREFVNGYTVLENPSLPFDFKFFSLATETPVQVFGEYHTSYHDAVRLLFFRAMQEMARAAPGVNVAEITAATYRKIVAACWDATGVQQKEAEKQFQWLQAAVLKEAYHAQITVSCSSHKFDMIGEFKNDAIESQAGAKWRFEPGAAWYEGTKIPLRGIRWKLLKAFVENVEPLTATGLSVFGWEHDEEAEPNTIRTHISAIRKLLRCKLKKPAKFDPLPLQDQGSLLAWKLHDDLR